MGSAHHTTHGGSEKREVDYSFPARPNLRTVADVEEPDALAALPRTYRLAISLRNLGADDDLISECLEVDRAAVPMLYTVAEGKLAALRRA